MPPRQGQSQFMTPVSSLKAPSWEASDSREEGSERGEGCSGAVVGEVVVGESGGGGGGGEMVVGVVAGARRQEIRVWGGGSRRWGIGVVVLRLESRY